MKAHYAEVLARESACLAEIVDEVMLARWRRRIVDELMVPRSPYALALQQSEDVVERAEFLDRWRGLIAEAVDRLVRSRTMADAEWLSVHGRKIDVDAQKSAVLVLAAILGGTTLSQLAQDSRPLDAALELALTPFAAVEDCNAESIGNEPPTQ